MRIAVGSTCITKVEAAKEAWQVFSGSLGSGSREPVDYLSYGVSIASSQMALSNDALMKNASERVENLVLQLKREKTEADYYIGLENGFSIVDLSGARRRVFLESWAFVSDGHKGHFGHGGGILVPNSVATPVIDRGIDLSIALDRFSGERRVQSEKGPWGLLTKDIISSQHSFVIALIAAFAPFYNPKVHK